jgi:hypothetical protein
VQAQEQGSVRCCKKDFVVSRYYGCTDNSSYFIDVYSKIAKAQTRILFAKMERFGRIQPRNEGLASTYLDLFIQAVTANEVFLTSSVRANFIKFNNSLCYYAKNMHMYFSDDNYHILVYRADVKCIIL